MKKEKFHLGYFLSGPYKKAKTKGLSKYFGKYYWARRFYAKLISRVTPARGKILEIGCGFGDLLGFLENNFQTIGTDVSNDAIKEARRRLKNTKLEVLPAEKTGSLKEKRLDTVISSHILEHLKDPEIVIKSVKKLLKSAGIFFIVVPNPDSIGRKLKGKNWVGFRDKTHISLYAPDKWIRLLKNEGFIIEKVFGDGLWDSPYIPILPIKIQQIIFGSAAIIQTLSTISFIPINLGESLVLIARKK